MNAVAPAPNVLPMLHRSDGRAEAAPAGVRRARLFPNLDTVAAPPLTQRAALVASAEAFGATLGVRWGVTRGIAGLLRLAAVDATVGPKPLTLGVLPSPAWDAAVFDSRPDGSRRSAASPPVGRPARPSGRDAGLPTAAGLEFDPGTPAHRMAEALARFERRVLGLVADANPGLRAEACQAEARRLAQIHWHRLIVRDLVGGLADPKSLAAALGAGLPNHARFVDRNRALGPAAALEVLAVFDVLAQVIGGDDPDDPDRSLGDVLLARAPSSVPSMVAEVRQWRLARSLVTAMHGGLPTGQQVAFEWSLDPLPHAALASLWPDGSRATIEAADLATRTPLPLYVLLEAMLEGTGRLGPVGTHLIAEGLLGPIRDAFPERPIDPREPVERVGLRDRDGRPLVGLADLLRFIGAAGLAD